MQTVITATASPGPAPQDHTQIGLLRRQLKARLLILPYRAYLQCVAHLLCASGYSRVVPSGRERRKGRNAGGGWDLVAEVAPPQVPGAGALTFLAQVKQFGNRVVHQRSVDELRGACLRAGAHGGLLVTLGAFSAPAKQAAEADRRLAPVHLLDGEALLDLLFSSGVGVTHTADTGWKADADYFERLARQYSGSPAPATIAVPRAVAPGPECGAAPQTVYAYASATAGAGRKRPAVTVRITVSKPRPRTRRRTRRT